MGRIGSKEDTINWIKEIVGEANAAIYKYTSENPGSAGMGTTLVLALYTKDFLLFGNIGDSSGYVLKKGKLHKITYAVYRANGGELELILQEKPVWTQLEKGTYLISVAHSASQGGTSYSGKSFLWLEI